MGIPKRAAVLLVASLIVPVIVHSVVIVASEELWRNYRGDVVDKARLLPTASLIVSPLLGFWLLVRGIRPRRIGALYLYIPAMFWCLMLWSLMIGGWLYKQFL
jgi:hypothetical protein